jgi:hypothetical protein
VVVSICVLPLHMHSLLSHHTPPWWANKPFGPWCLHLAGSIFINILIITSHSHDFMNSVCTNTMNLMMKKKLLYYTGNYTTYVCTKQENKVSRMGAYNK